MRHIDEDTITQAVIARHAEAADARLRELMTSLVQHLHGFAREVQLTEAEWRSGIRFLTEAGRVSQGSRQELALLSDTLGLSTLVTAMNQRKPAGCTEATPAGPGCAAQVDPAEPCFVRGRVLSLHGAPLAGAEVRLQPEDTEHGAAGSAPAAKGTHAAHGSLAQAAQTVQCVHTDAQGRYQFRSVRAGPHPVAQDGPVGRMLQALGRHAWRPAHLHFLVRAPGHETLVTHVFRRGGRYIDSDALFGVRRSLVADWVAHAGGPTPDGGHSDTPFHTLDFDFVLNPGNA
jgi:hydroxyquinol 1,2-dioxygenase